MTVKAALGAEQRFVSWVCGLSDLDNDGYPAILVVCGTVFR